MDKATVLVMEIRDRDGWLPYMVVASYKEAEELARRRARLDQNETNFDPLGWRVRRVKNDDPAYLSTQRP